MTSIDQYAATGQLREWWAAYLCQPHLFEYVEIPGDGRTWSLPVARESVPAFEALARVMEAHEYYFRESAGGTYNCRPIEGSSKYSLHAYGIAIDINPSRNPYGSHVSDMPRAFVDDVEGLRTENGATVFTWGGDWSTPDPMHFQIDSRPSDIMTGIEGEDMPTLDEIRDVVREELDRRLDGKAGPVNGFYGIGGSVATIGIGSTNPDTGEAPPLALGGYLQKTYTRVKSIDSQVGDSGASSTGGVTAGEVSEMIDVHADDPNAHHE